MQPFDHHVIVCTQQKPENVTCCAASGAGAVLEHLRAEIVKHGLGDNVLVSTTGCLGACEHGPVMIVYPDGVWYGALRATDVAEIVASHLKAGKPVERLMLTDAAALRVEILDHRKHYMDMMAARDRVGALPEDFNDMVRGFMPSRAVLTGVELNVFTAIGDGASAKEVANKLATDPRATEMLLNALAAIKLLQKSGDRFHNSPVAARFLVESSPDSWRWALMHTVNLWDRWSTMTECVRRGTALPRAGRDEDSTKAFIAAMERNAGERVGMLIRAMGNGFKRMLDLGGGSGAYSIAFAKANPELKAEVLDMPAVLPLTNDYIRRAGLETRVSTREGNMLTDNYGTGFDLVLLSQIAHQFSPEQNRHLFRKAYEALAEDGRLVVQDFVLEADKTSPRAAALFSLNMLVGTEAGASYSEPEYDRWLRDAGFQDVKRVRMPGPANLMIATK